MSLLDFSAHHVVAQKKDSELDSTDLAVKAGEPNQVETKVSKSNEAEKGNEAEKKHGASNRLSIFQKIVNWLIAFFTFPFTWTTKKREGPV